MCPDDALCTGLYRNSMSDVQRFLTERHGHSYCVYNLCSEEAYAYKPQSFEHVANFPFDDHQACMALLRALLVLHACEAHAWM